MAVILPVQNHTPAIGPHCFMAPTATLTGDVVCGHHCSFWFNAVVRGDVNAIRIGDYTNIQDGAVVHGSFGQTPTLIGSRVTVGHQAIIHGCTIEDEVLIGMSAIVLDHAVVQKGCIVAAGAIVLEGMVLEPGFLYAGIPARKIKQVSESQRETIRRTSTNYPVYASWYGEAFQHHNFKENTADEQQ